MLEPTTPTDHAPMATSAPVPNVELLRWPAEDNRRRLLAALGQPRLLLLPPNTPTPVLLDNLEQCIPDDSPPNVVVTSITTLQQRAMQDAEPVLDDDGLLWFRGHWVAVSDAQIPVVDLLVQNYKRLVHNDDIRRAYHDSGGSTNRASFRTLLRRIAQRLTKVQLTLHVVPRRGVILGPEDGPLRALA